MASVILGVMGKKRMGKDTFASRLVAAHGYTRIAFADALKDSILDLDPWVRIEQDETGFLGYPPGSSPGFLRLAEVVKLAGWEDAKSIREVRRLLQEHGVSIRTHVAESAWVDAAAQKAAAVPGPVVITDVRFRNEACWVDKQHHGLTLRVHNPRVTADDTHISETALDHWMPEIQVTNDTTIEDLHAEADKVAEFIKHRIG